MSVSSDRFYTWIDVESRFRGLLEAGRWPDWLKSVSAYTSGVELAISDASIDTANTWLREQFGLRIQTEGDSSHLELDGQGDRSLPISIEEVSDDQSVQLKFLFEPATRVARIKPTSLPPTSNEVSEIPLYAFHSFKGGVGRTTAALALALELSGHGSGVARRVLLIDADMEAPGISFLLEKRVPNLPISFADFLALANEGLATDQSVAINTAVEALKVLDFNGLVVLPAFRAAESYESVTIRPEHLIRNSKDAFVISRLIRQLGKALEVDAVIVDLRAGISEVSAGLILDPTVNRVLVTTLGGQSTRGTRSILAKMMRSDAFVSCAFGGDLPKRDVTLVISQVREDQRESVLPSEVEDILGEAGDGKELPRVCVVDYVGDLALMSRSWDACLTQVRRSNIAAPIRGIADAVFAKEASMGAAALSGLNNVRSKLSSYAKHLEFAEAGAGDSFLVTSSLDHLASDHLTELPLVTVVGQKGAGKSYTYLQLVRQGDWSNFVAKAVGRTDAVKALIFPLLEPLNLGDDARQLTRAARTRVCDRLGTIPLGQTELRDLIREGLRHGSHEGELRQTWLRAMARALGLNAKDDAEAIVESIRSSGLERIIFVVDGLEDLLQDVHTDETEQRALRSLLNEVSSWFSQIPGRPIGLLVFVRRDMVLAAIKQNPGQFFHRYQPYELRWNREEALRLVVWVTNQSGAMQIEIGETESEERLAEHLIPLWGLKLGSNDSREARTAEWVLAALSDFKGQVQARDVVRFLKVAATESIDDVHWDDRVLTPPGLRKAPVHCGREKIGEIGQETPRLKEVFSKIRVLGAELRRVPFAASDLHITIEEIELLERNGIVLREPDGYYMPEMYRQGLDFVVPKGARPRVLALARRAGVGSARYD